MKLKTFLTAVLIAAMSVSGTVSAIADDTAVVSSADTAVKVYLNGYEIEYSSGNYARIVNDRTMVPIRETAVALGMSVEWDASTNTMTFTDDDGNTVTHEMTTNIMTVNGETKTYTANSIVINNYTFMPLIMLADVTGMDPIWDASSKCVFLVPASEEDAEEETEDIDEEEYEDEDDEEEEEEKVKYDDGDITMLKYISVKYDTGKDKDGGRAVNYVYNADNGGFVVANLYNELYINILDSDYNIKEQQRIFKEGFEIGGYFYYNNYHYVLFGRENTSETNTTVYRLTRYSTDFRQTKTVNVTGDMSKIAEPFRNGKVNMVFDGKVLTINDVGLKYKENNKNNNCNVAINIDIPTFTIRDVEITSESNTNSASVINAGLGQTTAMLSDNNIAVAGLSTARPKGLYFKAEEIGSDNEDDDASVFITLLEASKRRTGTDLGITLSGLMVSDNYCLTAGNSIDQTSLDAADEEQRNVFVIRTSKSEINARYTETNWITDYAEGDDIEIPYQKFIKYSDNIFLLMWQEIDSDGDSVVKYVYIDGEGKALTDTPRSDDNGIVTISGRLSSTEPLLSSDKKMVYFATTENDGDPIELMGMTLSTPASKTR